MDVKREIQRIRERMKLDCDDLMLAMGTHREAVNAGFDRVREACAQIEVALLEQELTLRSHADRTDERFEQFLTRLNDHEDRLRKLEGWPPAA